MCVRESKFSLLTRVVFKTLFLAQRVFSITSQRATKYIVMELKHLLTNIFFFSETTKSVKERTNCYLFFLFSHTGEHVFAGVFPWKVRSCFLVGVYGCVCVPTTILWLLAFPLFTSGFILFTITLAFSAWVNKCFPSSLPF